MTASQLIKTLGRDEYRYHLGGAVVIAGEAGDGDAYDAVGDFVEPADGAGFKLDVTAGVSGFFQDKAQHVGVVGVVDSHLRVLIRIF
jgi:hypothetical protein